MAMAHRGRLNVLANIIGKSPARHFPRVRGHRPGIVSRRRRREVPPGLHNDYLTSSGAKVHLALCFNPSHLEFVNPVALGLIRAKQERGDDGRAQRAWRF